MALVGVMLVVAVLYIRHAPKPDDSSTRLDTVEAAAAATEPSATTGARTDLGGADKLLAATGSPDSDVEGVTTITAVTEPISLYALAAKAALEAAAAEAKATTTVKKVVAKPAATPTTTTTKAPKPAAATTTTQPVSLASATPPPSTTTTITATPGVFGSGQTASGNASWFGATDGTCAHRTLPFGTIVKVTRIRTGATATCRVNDRGPSDESRVIDLSDDVFESLAPKGAGLMPVKIEW